MEGGRKREGGREGGRKGETDRHTDRQTDRQGRREGGRDSERGGGRKCEGARSEQDRERVSMSTREQAGEERRV